jgi:hypothetical protein
MAIRNRDTNEEKQRGTQPVIRPMNSSLGKTEPSKEMIAKSEAWVQSGDTYPSGKLEDYNSARIQVSGLKTSSWTFVHMDVDEVNDFRKEAAKSGIFDDVKKAGGKVSVSRSGINRRDVEINIECYDAQTKAKVDKFMTNYSKQKGPKTAQQTKKEVKSRQQSVKQSRKGMVFQKPEGIKLKALNIASEAMQEFDKQLKSAETRAL